MEQVIGYLLFVAIGLALGMLGGGGAILTVPVLVIAFGLSPVVATAYSLFIVGVTASVGAARYYQGGQISVYAMVWFGVPSLAAVWLSRKWIVPSIPDPIIISFRDIQIGKDVLLMLLFSIFMLLASYFMLRKKSTSSSEAHIPNSKYRSLPMFGLLEGLVSGTLGAGGGFIILPILVVVAGMDMRKAVGTSLGIIAFKSLLGFTGDPVLAHTDWKLLFLILLFTLSGLLIGTRLAQNVPAKVLSKLFGYMVRVLGIFLLLRELIGLL
jgi:hypothetical protein